MDRDAERGNRFYRTHSRSASWTLPRNTSGLATSLEPLRTAFVELAGLSTNSSAIAHGAGQSQPVTPVYSSATGPFELEQLAYPSTTSSSANGSAVSHRRTESATSLSSASHPLNSPVPPLSNAPIRSQSSPNFDYEAVNVEARDQTNEGEEAGVEVKLAVRWLQRCLPFVLLFLIKVFWDHRLGVCVFVGLWFMFIQTNRLIRQQVALQDRCQLFEILKVIVLLSGNIFFIYYVFESQQLYKCLIFQKPYLYLDLWNIMWTLGITDFVIRFLTMVMKCFILCVCKQCLPARRKGKYYMLLEQMSQCYRMLVPVTVWVSFFFAYHDKVSFLLALIFVALYALLKVKNPAIQHYHLFRHFVLFKSLHRLSLCTLCFEALVIYMDLLTYCVHIVI
jgi:hypothetical protein